MYFASNKNLASLLQRSHCFLQLAPAAAAAAAAAAVAAAAAAAAAPYIYA